MKMSKLSKRALYRHRANGSTLLQVPNRLKDPQATILQKNQSMTHPLQQIQSKQQMKQSKSHNFSRQLEYSHQLLEEPKAQTNHETII